MLLAWVSEGSDMNFVEDRAIACLQHWQQDGEFIVSFVSKDDGSNMRCVALRVSDGWLLQSVDSRGAK